MPTDFDPSFQITNWSWWIVLYFFVGGIAGGIYFGAAWLDLFGESVDRGAMRIGHLLAFPLIIVSAVFLAVDLGQPLRFWHMIFQSENFPLPIFKAYSPMSFGSAILAAFGLFSFLSFIDALFGHNHWLHAGPVGKVISVLGALTGLALAGYTGVLLNVGNEPVWGDSPWISALFLFSGISTGLAALILVTRRSPTVEKLSEADSYMMVFELVILVVFLATLGAVGARFIFGSPTLILFAVVFVVCLILPLAFHFWLRSASAVSGVLVLIGGFVLRWAVLAGPQGIGL